MGLLFHYGFGLGDACGAPGRFHNIHVKINGSAYLIPLTDYDMAEDKVINAEL